MMNKLSKELRQWSRDAGGPKGIGMELVDKAADEIERLSALVIRAAEFCDYETYGEERAEFGIRCCCGTRDFEPHKKDCEYGKEIGAAV